MHTVELEIPASIQNSPFFIALKASAMMLIIVAAEGEGVLDRSWCALEIFLAMVEGGAGYLTDIYAHHKGEVRRLTDGLITADENKPYRKTGRDDEFPLPVVLRALSFEMREMKTAVQIDKDNITAFIDGMENGEAVMNATVRARFFVAALPVISKSGDGLALFEAGAKALQLSTLPRLTLTSALCEARALTLVCSLPSTLVQLQLPWVGIGDALAIRLGEFINCQRVSDQLTELDLTGNKLGDKSAAALGKALEYALLAELNLSRNQITDSGAVGLAEELMVNAALTKLDLASNKLTDVAAIALACMLKVNVVLQELSLWGNQIADRGALDLAKALEVNESLTTLRLGSSLGGNNIGDVGAIGLGKALAVNAALKTLHLDGNQIADMGATGLAEALYVNDSLTSLGLSLNKISNQGAIGLAKALEVNASLNMLDLKKNQVADPGAIGLAKALEGSTSLKYLCLDDNQITDQRAFGLVKVRNEAAQAQTTNAQAVTAEIDTSADLEPLLEVRTGSVPRLIDDHTERTVSLAQLEGIAAVVRARCAQGKPWLVKDHMSDKLKPVVLDATEVNLYHFVDTVTKPMTAKAVDGHTCSLVEWFGNGAHKLHVFVSHFWGDPILGSVACILDYVKLRKFDPKRTRFWICAHANNQHTFASKARPRDSPFFDAIRMSTAVLAIVDESAEMLTRAWCVFEAASALERGQGGGGVGAASCMYDVVTRYGHETVTLTAEPVEGESAEERQQREGRFPPVLAARAIQFDVGSMRASKQDDYEAIVADIGEQREARAGLRSFEATVRARYFLSALGAISFSPYLLEAGLCALELSRLVDVIVDFASVSGLHESWAMDRLLPSLPQTLERLELASCELDGEALAAALPGALSSLTSLTLVRTEITEAVAFGLGQGIKTHASLTSLRLNKVGAKAAAPLARALEVNASLTKLWLGDNKFGEACHPNKPPLAAAAWVKLGNTYKNNYNRYQWLQNRYKQWLLHG